MSEQGTVEGRNRSSADIAQAFAASDPARRKRALVASGLGAANLDYVSDPVEQAFQVAFYLALHRSAPDGGEIVNEFVRALEA